MRRQNLCNSLVVQSALSRCLYQIDRVCVISSIGFVKGRNDDLPPGDFERPKLVNDLVDVGQRLGVDDSAHSSLTKRKSTHSSTEKRIAIPKQRDPGQPQETNEVHIRMCILIADVRSHLCTKLT
jgi:hypothetical protein